MHPGAATRAASRPSRAHWLAPTLPQAENILTLTKAAGIEVEPYWPGLFAKLVEKKSVEDFITNVGAGERRGRDAPPDGQRQRPRHAPARRRWPHCAAAAGCMLQRRLPLT